MKVMISLIRWHLQQLRLINSVVLCAAVILGLFWPSAITFQGSSFAMMAVLVHCAVMAVILGRSESRGPGFLYAQGFSRDQLWWSTFFASLASGLTACVGLALVISTGLRGLVQQGLGNPWFPLAGTVEVPEIRWFLLEYCLLLPPAHYVWIRARQPLHDAAAGWMLAIGIVMFYGFGLGYRGRAGLEFFSFPVCADVLLALLTLFGCWRFHRQVEVQA